MEGPEVKIDIGDDLWDGYQVGIRTAIAALEDERVDRQRRGHPNIARGLQVGIERMKRLEVTNE
jgi:hypothetical protein